MNQGGSERQNSSRRRKEERVTQEYKTNREEITSVLRSQTWLSNLKSVGVLGSLLVELLEVEVQLLTLKNVTVTSTGLTGPAGDLGEESTLLESRLEVGLDLGLLLSLGQDSLDVVRLLDLGLTSLGGLGRGGNGGLGTLEDGGGVVSLVPLSERSGIDLDDGTHDEGLGSEKLVVGGVVHLKGEE